MIQIRGKEYSVGQFSDLHLLSLDALFQNPGNIDLQSEVGFVLSEIAIADLGDDLVRQSKGKYILLMNSGELAKISLDLHKVFWERSLELAIAEQDKEKEAIAKEILEKLNSAD